MDKEEIEETVDRHLQLIRDLASLSDTTLIMFTNMLYIRDKEMFETMRDVTEWERGELDEFLEKVKKIHEQTQK